MDCAANYLIYCKALFTGRKALIRKTREELRKIYGNMPLCENFR